MGNRGTGNRGTGYRNRHFRILSPEFPLPHSQQFSQIPDIAQVCAEYEKRLRERIAGLKILTPTYDDIPQAVVVKRALDARKPFTASQKSYRDTLIWETVLRKVADGGHETVLVTGNKNDFSDAKDSERLHQQLEEDVTQAGFPHTAVGICTDLARLVRERILPEITAGTDDIISALETDSYGPLSIKNWFIENAILVRDMPGDWLEDVLRGSDFESPEVVDVDLTEPVDVQVDGVTKIDDATVIAEATATCTLVVEGFVYKGDYYASEGVPYHILDSDWNEHYIWAEQYVKLPVRFSVTIDVVSNKVVNDELQQFGEIYGHCSSCGVPILHDAAESCTACGVAWNRG